MVSNKPTSKQALIKCDDSSKSVSAMWLCSVSKQETNKHLSYLLNSSDSHSLYLCVLELLVGHLDTPEHKGQFHQVCMCYIYTYKRQYDIPFQTLQTWCIRTENPQRPVSQYSSLSCKLSADLPDPERHPDSIDKNRNRSFGGQSHQCDDPPLSPREVMQEKKHYLGQRVV